MEYYLTGCRRRCSLWLWVMPASGCPEAYAGLASHDHMLSWSHGEHILCSFPVGSQEGWCDGTSQTFQNDQYFQPPVPE